MPLEQVANGETGLVVRGKINAGLTAIDANTTAIAAKADASTTTTALAAKADASAMTTALALKADASAVTTSLAAKADASSVTTSLALKADLASPALTGNPTATTQTAGNNTTRLATTAFVTTAVAAVGGTATAFNRSKAANYAARGARRAVRKPANYIVDRLGTAALAAWGFIKQRSAYSGNCCKVRQVSSGTLFDIPFLADGVVDTDYMRALAGTDGLRLHTFYDHMAGGLDRAQTTDADQPVIDLDFLRAGVPAINGGALPMPAGLTITSTANCAVWSAMGAFSNKLGTTLYDFGASTWDFSLFLTPQSAFSVQPAVSGSALSFGTMDSIPNANGCVVGINSAAGGMTLYRNDYTVARAAVSAVSVTGGVGFGVNPFDLYAQAVFNAALSTADAALLQAGWTAQFEAVKTAKANALLHGDSIVASAVAYSHNYNKVLNDFLPPNVSLYNLGVGGSTAAAMAGDVSAYVAPLFKTGIPNVAVMLGGVNDISGGATAAALIASWTTWAAAVKAAGYRAGLATLYPRDPAGSGFNSSLAAITATANAWARANSGPGLTFDFLVDFENETAFVPTITTADFPDNLHPNLKGYRKATPVLADAIIAQIPGV